MHIEYPSLHYARTICAHSDSGIHIIYAATTTRMSGNDISIALRSSLHFEFMLFFFLRFSSSYIFVFVAVVVVASSFFVYVLN